METKVSYDHRNVATRFDADDVHAEMRAKCPVAHSSEYGGFWVLTGYQEVEASTRDTATF